MKKRMADVRKLDELGRVCLPAEMRVRLRIESGAMLSIDVEGDRIILRKAAERCYICGEEGETRRVMNKNVCLACLAEARREAPLTLNDGW